jgi:Protein of unknown function (DUF3352)
MAALAATPVAPPPAKRRRGLFASIAALCIVAVLSAGAYWIFTGLANANGQTAAASDLPDSTVLYVSVDLVAANNNSHHVTAFDPARTFGPAFQKSTGLNWQSDVTPWLGRMATVAVFPGQLSGAVAGNSTATPSTAASSLVNAVGILQSRDDGAAERTIAKLENNAQQHGATFSQSSYGGYTLRTTAAANTLGFSTVANGKGLVILANTESAAKTVIDRSNGQGTNLAGKSDFQRAVGDLPVSRFGTLYASLGALTDPLHMGASVVNIPFLNTYPTAAGALLWTSAGERWQVTFRPTQRGLPANSVAGDTTSLASMVPQEATAYIGAANVGQLTSELTGLFTAPGSKQSADPFQSSLGVPASDPALQVPGALYLGALAAQTATGGTGAQSGPAAASPQGAVLLREPDAATANALVARVAQHNQWKGQPTTVDGVPATVYTETQTTTSATQVSLRLDTRGSASATEVISTATAASTPVAYSAMVNGTLVLATSQSALTTVIETSRGAHASLAQLAQFHQLTGAAPSGSALTAYVDLSSYMKLLGAAASSLTGSSTTTGPSPTAGLFTFVWNADELQLTTDIALSQ